MPEIKKNGRVTVYGFACGYIESKDNNGIKTTLWMEHGTYHVRQHDFNVGKRNFWKSFPTLTEARKLFNAQKGE